MTGTGTGWGSVKPQGPLGPSLIHFLLRPIRNTHEQELTSDGRSALCSLLVNAVEYAKTLQPLRKLFLELDTFIKIFSV